MKILLPNIRDTKIQYIPKNHVYVKVTDYGRCYILKEIYLGPGYHTWYWIEMSELIAIDISSLHYQPCTFDDAINKSVNNIYCIVYEFDNYSEMINKWGEIKYVDNITTVYKSNS